MAPAIAVLGPIRREGQPVVGCIANRAQDRPPLVGRGSVSFWERYRTRQRHARIFRWQTSRIESAVQFFGPLGTATGIAPMISKRLRPRGTQSFTWNIKLCWTPLASFMVMSTRLGAPPSCQTVNWSRRESR